MAAGLGKSTAITGVRRGLRKLPARAGMRTDLTPADGLPSAHRQASTPARAPARATMRVLAGAGRTCAWLACATSAIAASAPPAPAVVLQGQHYTVDIADDDAERMRGLMFRDAMPAGHGMLFVHDHAMPRAYWMKNTRIPLDILYFDDARRLVTQYRNVPPCTLGDACPTYPSTGSVRYVLELNAGQAQRLGVLEGAVVELVLVPASTGEDTP